jgi:hypothetical protein
MICVYPTHEGEKYVCHSIWQNGVYTDCPDSSDENKPDAFLYGVSIIPFCNYVERGVHTPKENHDREKYVHAARELEELRFPHVVYCWCVKFT